MTTSRASQVFLAFSALVWLPYGIYCFLEPGSLAANAGVSATTVTATVELRAMYGGLQAALGLLAFGGLVYGGWRRHALFALLFLCAGLGSTRLFSAFSAGDFSEYTVFALGFELGSTVVAASLVSR